MSAERLLDALRDKGMRGGILPVHRLNELGRDITTLRDNGQIDTALYDKYLKGKRYAPPEQMPDARSIVVVAVPVPKMRLHFTWQGKDLPVIVPPTYSDSAAINVMVKDILTHCLEPTKAIFEWASLPYKTLAARSGIAQYGRNNIAYVPGHGSFHRLTAFFTDIDLGVDHWQERKALERCEGCKACLRACPASAIADDRFLVRAEKCLTNLNEMPSIIPFPNNVGPDWHNAIVGCMKCQEACPENRDVRDWTVEGETFDEESTRYLLDGDFSWGMAKELEERLERYGLELDLFPRNLKALMKD